MRGEVLQQEHGKNERDARESVETLSRALSARYVRKDSKFYAVDRLGTKLCRDDVERSAVTWFADEFTDYDLSSPTLKEVFKRAITAKHSDVQSTIPTWNGSERCDPNEGRFIRKDGMVTVNSWSPPPYRTVGDVAADLGKAGEFFDAIFTRDAEKAKFLDWLAWCLQNEGDKPTWAPFFYSKTKGSGKSTLCLLVAHLFGTANTVTQNSVDKLTSRFNTTVLTSKLVISEELNLRPDSAQGNALKTHITEEETVGERKGQEAVRMRQCCCFLFTSNHMPLWIEANDRRYYLVEIDHDGHASGPKAQEFSDLVGELRDALEDDRFLAAVYAALMDRTLPPQFSAKTLNVEEDATPLMRKVHGASEQATVAMMREHLDELGQHAVPEADVTAIIAEVLRGNMNTAKHLMTELGWTKGKAKWGGKDYQRSIWVRDGYWIDNGTIRGPGDYRQKLSDHLEEPDPFPDLAAVIEKGDQPPRDGTDDLGALY